MGKLMKNLNPRNWLELSSPVTLGFAGLSLIALILGWLTRGAATRALFMVYRSSPAAPLFYPRLVLHALGHADFAHYASNMALLLVLGPLVEKQYGGARLVLMMLVTALVTGLTHLLLSSGAALGASGIVFMMILLAAASGRSSGKIPLSLLLVALIYLGQELAGLFQRDNVSQLAHLIGGLCGLGFGLAVRKKA